MQAIDSGRALAIAFLEGVLRLLASALRAGAVSFTLRRHRRYDDAVVKGGSMAISRQAISQGTILKNGGLDAAGVCLEACRRWVRAALSGNLVFGDTIYEIISQNSINELLTAHKKRNNKSEKNMEGLTLSVTRRTGGGIQKFKGLRSRQDVIDHVMSVPGVYIYVVEKSKGGGHAFSFNSANRQKILFMDPNLGEWLLENESDAAVRAWWHKFWEGSDPAFTNLQSYKNAYNKGERELWRYTTADEI